MRKRDIAIDLTSLLDVIFIILLIVMCGQQISAENAAQDKERQYNEKLAGATEAEDKAVQEKELFEQHKDKYEQTDKYVLFIDVSAKVTSVDGGKTISRTLMVLNGASDVDVDPFNAEITSDNERFKYTELKEYLKNKIEDYNKDTDDKRPIVLSVNKGDDDILYRDEINIESVFEDLKKEYNNIY